MTIFILAALSGLLALGLIAASAAIIASRHQQQIALANAYTEVTTHKHKASYLSDGALTRYLLLKFGSDSRHVTTCGANDVPLGNSEDAPDAAEYPTEVAILGLSDSSRVMIASEAITVGSPVFTAASGKVQDLPGTSGTYYQVGFALTASAADGDQIEIATCVPIKTVV